MPSARHRLREKATEAAKYSPGGQTTRVARNRNIQSFARDLKGKLSRFENEHQSPFKSTGLQWKIV